MYNIRFTLPGTKYVIHVLLECYVNTGIFYHDEKQWYINEYFSNSKNDHHQNRKNEKLNYM